MRPGIPCLCLVGGLLGCVLPAAPAAEGSVTTTFGTAADCAHPGTLTVEGDVLRFDLSALGPDVKVQRAALHVSRTVRWQPLPSIRPPSH